MLRFLMIFGIVLLHTPKNIPIELTGPGGFDFIKSLFQNVVFRTTVPVLTCISGYLLFSANLDQHPIQMFKKKFKTLVIPFAVFNGGLFAVAYCIQAKTGKELSYDLIPFDAAIWGDALLSLTSFPINYPLNFLRDLVVLVVMAPMFGILLRSTPLTGLAVLWGFFMYNLDGWLVLRNNMPVMFYVGGMIALGKGNLFMLDKYAPMAFFVFVALSVTLVIFRVANTNYFGYVAPFLLWSAASLIVNKRIGKWMGKLSKYSFFIFIAHAPVLFATWVVYEKFAAYIPYPVYCITAPVFTTALLIGMYQQAMKIAPRIFSTAIGAKCPVKYAKLVKVA